MALQEYFINHVSLKNEWMFDRNPESPERLQTRSRTKAWWRCDKGHEWQAAIESRVYGGWGCPYCAGKLPILGETDLATTHPELLPMWSERNTLTPFDVSAGSNKKVWWRCEKGHEWETAISTVTLKGCGCPYCEGKRAIPGENDLATVRPALLNQWDYEKNKDVSPQEILPSAHDKVWWRCELGHSYAAVVYSRTRENDTGCPYCAGRKVLVGFNDLATLKPKLAEQWYAPLNGKLRPEDVTLGSNKKVWWQCREGHVWQAAIYSRTRRRSSGCPVCAGTVRISRATQEQKTRRKQIPLAASADAPRV